MARCRSFLPLQAASGRRIEGRDDTTPRHETPVGGGTPGRYRPAGCRRRSRDLPGPGRLLTPDYAFGLFGQAGLGVVMLICWRRSPSARPSCRYCWRCGCSPLLACCSRAACCTRYGGAPDHRLCPVRVHRADRAALPDRLRRATHQPQGGGAPPGAAVLFTARSPRRCCWSSAGGCPAGRCQPPGARSPCWPASCWYTSALWYYNGYQLPGI